MSVGVVQVPWGGLLLSPEQAAAVALMEDAVRAYWRAKGLAVPALQAEVLAAAQGEMERLREHRARATSAPSSAVLPRPRPAASAAPQLSWLTAKEAAARLSVSTRAVTDACKRGSLRAVRAGDGTGAWRVDPTSLCNYRPRSVRGREGAADAA